MHDEPDIVVVGAGAAGIGAVRALENSGLSVTVLEALPRAGGRAHTREAAGIPLDLGCGWLHSAGRNPWTVIAEELGFSVDRRPSAWGDQSGNGSFSVADQASARRAFGRWSEKVVDEPPASDIAAELLEPGSRWTTYLQLLSGFISGAELEAISAQDYAAYDSASTEDNWRVQAGYGTLITASLPAYADLRLATPVKEIVLDRQRVSLRTPKGIIRPRAVIITVSTNVIAGDAIRWPSALDPWRAAARLLPLGNNEKFYLEIVGDAPFEAETHALGDPHDPQSGSYYIRPFGWPVIECFLGGRGARAAAAEGPDAAFQRAIKQLADLFGSSVRRSLQPLVHSDWAGTPSIGGGYSHALPGHADARLQLARPFADRLFFAGEATHIDDFSTAHGAYESGRRAATEAKNALTHAIID